MSDETVEEREALERAAESEAKARLSDRIKQITNGGTGSYTMPDVERSRLTAEESRERSLRLTHEVRDEKWCASIPPMWTEFDIESLPPDFQYAANNWLANGFPEGKNLVMMSDTGVGKTTTAYAIAREIYLRGHKVKIYQIAELMDELRPGGREDLMENVKKADLLVLDDLGSEKVTEAKLENLIRIVDHRWQWRLPIIVTTNLDLKQLNEAITKRTLSRLLDKADIIKASGPDLRRPR